MEGKFLNLYKKSEKFEKALKHANSKYKKYVQEKKLGLVVNNFIKKFQEPLDCAWNKLTMNEKQRWLEGKIQ